MTPADFWKLWDNKLRQYNKSTGGDKMSLSDLEELEKMVTGDGNGQ